MFRVVEGRVVVRTRMMCDHEPSMCACCDVSFVAESYGRRDLVLTVFELDIHRLH